MEHNQYVEVKTCPEEEVNYRESKTFIRKHFLRQMLVCSGVWTSYFMSGLVCGTPTVMIPQLRTEANSTEAVTIEMASWLSSTSAYAGLPWAIFISGATRIFGRKRPLLVINIIVLINFIAFYISNDLIQILTSLAMFGVLMGSQITIGIIIIPEYSSPQYRAWLLPVKSASTAWGMWVANAIGTFTHWKWIAICGIICSIYNFVTIFFWPESPLWLASRGNFQKCAKSHRWLKGSYKCSEMELESLITNQNKYLTYCKEHEATGISSHLKNFSNLISSREFYKPILLSLTAISLYHFSGKFVCAIYSLDIIKEITSDQNTAYVGMLILDVVTVLGMYIGCALTKFLNRRTMLFLFSCFSISFLFIISLYLYLINLSVIVENKYLSLVLLSAFSFFVSGGVFIIVAAVFSELTPMRYRNFSLCLYGIYFQFLFGTVLKVAPFIFETFKMYGAFLFYGLTSSIFTLILYFYLPETNNKTIQEIEDSMKKL